MLQAHTNSIFRDIEIIFSELPATEVTVLASSIIKSTTNNNGCAFLIREILKSLPARVGLALEAKVPQAAKRSTCTLSTLISLNAELVAYTA